MAVHTSAGPVQKVIQAAGEDAVRRVLDAVLTADRRPDGAFRQDNVTRYVKATVVAIPASSRAVR